MKIYYLVYQLTNTVNGKIYIGCHVTKNINDNYMGSGRRLAYAKRKYGLDSFKKEILSIHETAESMFAEETRLVNEEFLSRKDVYNLNVGGKGGWHHQNSNSETQRIKCLKGIEKQRQLRMNPEWKAKETDKKSQLLKQQFAEGKRRHTLPDWTGKSHRDETKKIIGEKNSVSQSGKRNSNYGKKWIYSDDQQRSKSISIDDVESYLLQGWKLGRKMKFSAP